MNYDRRRSLRIASRKLDEAYWLLSHVIDGEQDAMDNTPENMQDGERFQEREEYLDALNGLAEELDDFRGRFTNNL